MAPDLTLESTVDLSVYQSVAKSGPRINSSCGAVSKLQVVTQTGPTHFYVPPRVSRNVLSTSLSDSADTEISVAFSQVSFSLDLIFSQDNGTALSTALDRTGETPP